MRWAPDAKQRLQAAALEAFLAHGYDATTVHDIAAAAGLTERTFFRHFADKREVLFLGQAEYLASYLDGIRSAPVGAAPLDLVRAALASVARFFPEERRPWSRGRGAVLDATPALQERELLKRAQVVADLTAALERRGLDGTTAALTAETVSAVFHVAFRRWLDERETRAMPELLAEALHRLAGLLAPAG